jgi:hypothetical protein
MKTNEHECENEGFKALVLICLYSRSIKHRTFSPIPFRARSKLA